jgi:hypothetical protein
MYNVLNKSNKKSPQVAHLRTLVNLWLPSRMTRRKLRPGPQYCVGLQVVYIVTDREKFCVREYNRETILIKFF